MLLLYTFSYNDYPTFAHCIINRKFIIMKNITTLTILIALALSSLSHAQNSKYQDQSTQNMFKALQIVSKKGYTMFGMANALTIGYSTCLNDRITSSDIKDVIGDNPAFIESDFMWYGNKEFQKWDMEAMRQAHKRGNVVGYCWHMAGPLSQSFGTRDKNGEYTQDINLVKRILSNKDRSANPDLDWYLSQIDTIAIPVFKALDFPLIYRPFHEMTGDWFWWGRLSGPENYVKLYRLTVDYLRSAGIRNLLYCWAPDKDADMRYYPGDEYVDILGYDAYEPGLKPYITETILIQELGKLVEYAETHNKVAAWTEVGLRSETPEELAYPTQHPDFWTKYVWNVVKNNPKTNRLAWVMTWYNADWDRKGESAPYVPFLGMKFEGSEAAVADFKKLYKYNNSLFEKDMPDMNGHSGDNSLFILPQNPTLSIGEKIQLIGGTKCNWFNENVEGWSTGNKNVITIDKAGKVIAIGQGTATVTLKIGKKQTNTQIIVK